MIADARLDSAGPAPPLLGVGQRDPLRLQRRDVVLNVEVAHLDLAAVDDEDDVVDGDGRLGDVGRYHYLPHSPRGTSEDRLLVHLEEEMVISVNHLGPYVKFSTLVCD